MSKPGAMLYFDAIAPLQYLDYADKGRLLDAILAYAKDGTLPQFDGMLGMAWAFIKPKLDRDDERYNETVANSTYAAFCREIKRRSLPAVPKRIWLEMTPEERHQMLSSDVDRNPTADASPNTKSNTSVSPSPTTSAPSTAAEGDDDLDLGLVSLSAPEIDSLRHNLGEQDLRVYIARLRNHLAQGGTTTRTHYMTIYDWWIDEHHDRI